MRNTVVLSEVVRLNDELWLGTSLFPQEARMIMRDVVSPEDKQRIELLDVAVQELEEFGGALHALGLNDLGTLTPGGEDVRDEIAAAFAVARKVWSKIVVPNPEEFSSLGVNFKTVAEAMSADPSLTPVLAPHGLGLQTWIDAFDTLDGAPKLVVAREVSEEFIILDRVQDDSATFVMGSGPSGIEGQLKWTFALIPASDTPSVMGSNYSHATHPSCSEMLALQLARAVGGLPPVDTKSFTWLSGRIGDGRLVARHIFDDNEGVIRVSSREPAQQGPHQGARPPVRY